MGYRYVVMGCGMQGRAAAYDLAQFGEADSIVLADWDQDVTATAKARLEALTGRAIFEAKTVDVTDPKSVRAAFSGATAVFGGVPYRFNLSLTELAIDAKVHLCDLGGNTGVVLQQLELNDRAEKAGISIAPDCGLAPGLGNLLAADGIRRRPNTESVRIRCGGLPQKPKGPLKYHLVFNVYGLLNEYFGCATVLRDGSLVDVDTFTELEELEFAPPVGKVEAFVTSGGTSTAPWTFKGRIRNYDYKTVRYPGHYERFRAYKEIGLLETTPITVDGETFVPRDLFAKVLRHELTMPEEKDLVVLRVECREPGGRGVTYDLMDFHNEKTGFSAMERTTAFPATAVLILQAQGAIAPGVRPIEESVPTERYLADLLKRDIRLEIKEY